MLHTINKVTRTDLVEEKLKGLRQTLRSHELYGKVEQLKSDLLDLTGDVNFKKAENMGEILQAALDFVTRNYKNENPFIN